MSGELEAAGALATAGLAAGAIEGREGGEAGDGACLNCGAKVDGRYCSNCGQSAHPHRKLSHVVEELVHGVVHFDTKAWRTLPMVIFRPGTLTRNYVYGKRARYISPIALFLFTIFFMFFVFAFAMPSNMGLDATLNDTVEVTQADIDEARAELAEARVALEAARTNPPAGEPEGLSARLAENAVRLAEDQVSRLERQLEREQARAAERAAAENAEAPSTGAVAPAEGETQQAPTEGAAPAEIETAETQTSDADAGPFIGVRTSEENLRGERWQDGLADAVRRGDVDINMGHPKLDEKARETLLNPDLALYKIQQAAYKFSFLLAPLSLPFIALLFLWKRGVTLYDHMAYALYALSFASLLFVAMVLTGQVSWLAWLPGVLVGVGLPVHTFFHLKGAYALGWFSALWRTFFMLMFAIVILSIFISIILILGLTG